MSAHTPGPWVAARKSSQCWTIDAPNGDPTIGYSAWQALAVVYGCDDDRNAGEEVAKANARLIASAPELLAACIEAEKVLAGLDDDGCAEACESLRAAIAKAEGSP